MGGHRIQSPPSTLYCARSILVAESRAENFTVTEPDDATPLTPAERNGLRQSWITHRRDLNEAEQENIVQGAAWARRQRGLTAAKLLDAGFAQRLHGRMFGDVWEWAGAYRKTERNIGVAPYRIAPDLAVLLDDVALANRTGDDFQSCFS